MAPKQEPTLMEQLLKPLFDRLGLNGTAALEASRNPQAKKPTAPPPIDVNQLRRQGWSDKDIEYVLRQANGGTK